MCVICPPPPSGETERGKNLRCVCDIPKTVKNQIKSMHIMCSRVMSERAAYRVGGDVSGAGAGAGERRMYVLWAMTHVEMKTGPRDELAETNYR